MPFSQFLRYKRNCSEENEFKIQSQNLKSNFWERGYPKQVINRAYKRALFNNRELLLSPYMRNQTDDHNVNLVTKYAPYSSQIKHILKKHTNVLNSVSGLEEKSIRCVWQRHRNLMEILSPTVLRPICGT